MKSIYQVISFSKHKNKLILCSVLLALVGVSNIVYPHLYGTFIDSINTNAQTLSYLQYLYMILIYFSVCFLLTIVLTYFEITFSMKANSELRFRVSKNILMMNKKELQQKGEGYFTTLIDQSIFYVMNFFHPFYLEAILSVIKIPIIIILVARINTLVSLIIVLWVVFYIIFYRRNKKEYTIHFNAMMEANNKNNSLLINRLALSDLTKTFINIRKSFVQDIKKSIEVLEQKECKSNLYASIIHPLISIYIEPFIRICILFILAYTIYQEKIGLGDLIAVIAYFFIIKIDMERISSFTDGFMRAKESSKNILDFFLAYPPLHIKNISKDFTHFIVLQNFSYAIKQRNSALKNTNRTLEKNKIYALTGENGMGKSSFIKIITSQFDEYSGTVHVCGYDIKESPVNINYISQDLLIINDYTVIDNITLRHHAVDKNYLEQIISDLRIEYIIHERSNDIAYLSGGEKKKVILARFLYYLKEHGVFILDEMFSSFDKAYISYVLPVCKKYLEGKTGIVISHNTKVIRELCNSNMLNDILK